MGDPGSSVLYIYVLLFLPLFLLVRSKRLATVHLTLVTGSYTILLVDDLVAFIDSCRVPKLRDNGMGEAAKIHPVGKEVG